MKKSITLFVVKYSHLRKRGLWMRKLYTKRRRKRLPQVTCMCGAYEFPHRIGSGNCHGRAWAQNYFELFRGECKQCIYHEEARCQVADGSDEIHHCAGYQDHLRSQTDVRLPMDHEKFYAQHERVHEAELEYEEAPF